MLKKEAKTKSRLTYAVTGVTFSFDKNDQTYAKFANLPCLVVNLRISHKYKSMRIITIASFAVYR